MTKTNKIIYWVATLWLALGMASTGVVQLLHVKEESEMFAHLGYPDYLQTILGVWKILGVIVLLVPIRLLTKPAFSLLKQWAYAGFFFAMSGALFSHFAVGDGAKEFFGPSLLLVLTIVSWYYNQLYEKQLR